MTEIKNESGGVVRIADEVLSTIAGTAALETEGVVGLGGIGGYFSRETLNKALRKLRGKGISVAVTGRSVTIGLTIMVRMGTKLHEASLDVQRRVKSEIETMTGLDVAEVNVSVGAIVGNKKRAS